VEAQKHARKAIRFPLEAPIVFWWTDGGIDKQCEGHTRDMSESGAFVFASTWPPPGTQIGFKVFLPVLPGTESKARVEAVGQVLRVEQGRGGFAILTRHTLMRVSNNIDKREESDKNQSQLN